MSWQATAWALQQQTGSSAAKLTLLALCNYADEDGICWPSQERLAAETEQSVDTVQRRIKQLAALGLVRVERREGARGQWAGKIYYLNLSVAKMTKPQNAVRSKAERHAKKSPSPGRTEPGDHAANTYLRHHTAKLAAQTFTRTTNRIFSRARERARLGTAAGFPREGRGQ